MNESSKQRSALIVGASRGIGEGLARTLASRGWQVTATVRDRSRTGALGDGIEIETVDIDYPDQIAALGDRLGGAKFDLIFVVAGISNGNPATPIHQIATEEAIRIYRVNALGPLALIEALEANVASGGQVALMSSTLGSVARNTEGGYDAYRASKAALNTLARSYAARHRGRGVLVVHPGWVRTDMGGSGADIDVTESVRGIADMLDARVGETDAVFVDWKNREVPW